MNTNESVESIRLTQFSHGAGCGCKIAPAVLDEILQGQKPQSFFPNLLVGNESKDDAAILDIGDGKCLISTTDFFTPIVDDPFDYGRIAAANAISDVYAMGGLPVLAIAILGFPVAKIPNTVAGEIIAGAKVICEEAGIPLAGGHSIDTLEPIFGLAVNGLIDKSAIRKNNSARAGDLIYLSKPIGTGIIATALKRGKARDEDVKNAIRVMTTLNKAGAELSQFDEVHAMTDVTGFGLLGHLIEMCEGSKLSAQLNFSDVPLIEGLNYYIEQMIVPDSTYRNWNAYEKKVTGIDGPAFMSLCDPQTSGGLLIAVDPSYESNIKSFGPYFRKPVGRFEEKQDYVIKVNEG